MTLLGTIMQAGLSGALTLAPAAIPVKARPATTFAANCFASPTPTG